MALRLASLAAVLALLPAVAVADDPPKPAALVSAQRVKAVVRVTGVVEKKLMHVVDDGQGVGSTLNGVILTTRDKISVTVHHPNPLTTQVSASTTAVDDPSAGVFAKLLDAISGVAALVRPAAAGDAGSERADALPETFACQVVEDAEQFVKQMSLKALSDDLASPKKLGEAIDAWKTAAADKGRPGIVAAVALIKTHADSLQTNIDQAAKAFDAVRARADLDLSSLQAGLQQARDRIDVATTKLEDYRKTVSSKPTPAETAAIGMLAQTLADAREVAANEASKIDCERQARSVYRGAQVALPFAEIARLKNIAASVKALRTAIETTYLGQDVRNRWTNNDADFELIWDVRPTAEKGQRVTVKWVPISVALVDDSLQTKSGEAASATFDVYLFRRWVPELGLGVTFGLITRPKYGTSTEGGKTVVKRLADEQVSVEPTVMVNFLPWGEQGLTPMIQLGAAVSKTAPTILMGPGWRLPGSKGGAAIGLGLMLAWVKDLQSLKPGDPVGGTKDIDDDLGFGNKLPKTRLYVNLQYKF